jgi:hypothetical protein
MKFTFCFLKGIDRWNMEEIMISFVQVSEKCRPRNRHKDEIENYYYIFYRWSESFDTDTYWEDISVHCTYYMLA